MTETASGTAALIGAISGLAWPILAAIVLWRLFPVLRRVIDSRRFSIKLGGMEVSVQEASENLTTQVSDLQQKVSELRAAVEERKTVPMQDGGLEAAPVHGEQSPAVTAPRLARRILWVDDQPRNNAFEISKLRAEGNEVIDAKSTTEAMALIVSGREPFALVISDMGRREEGEYRAKAGVLLIQAIRRAGLDELPVFIYSSARYLERTKQEVLSAGGNGATASPVELFEAVHSILPPAG